jgi:uncharacterized protein DUF5825
MPARATVAEFQDPEESLAVDLSAALCAEVRVVRVAGTCSLSVAAPRTALALVRLLREASSLGVPVTWRGRIVDGIDARLLVHLPPPEAVPGEPVDPAMVEWRERYRPGLCYYRLGPGFVFIKDVRTTSASARYKIETVDELRTLEAVAEVASLAPPTQALLRDLEEEGLVLRLGDWATLLPHRMRRWPVPAHEV